METVERTVNPLLSASRTSAVAGDMIAANSVATRKKLRMTNAH
jgi:hypothetical protein